MQKKVTLFINDFAPDREGVSKEISLLSTHLRKDINLKITLHEISSGFKFYVSSLYISYGLIFLPIGIFITKYIEKQSDLIHVFGSLTGRLYMKMLKRRPILLTNSGSIQESRLRECKKAWGKIDMLVVECKRDERRVIDYGIKAEKVALIYPAVNIDAFSYQHPADRFKVGFASSPISNDRQGINKRGVGLLLLVAREMPDVDFVLLWREKHYSALKGLINKSTSGNVSVLNRILPDMNTFYGGMHCTILPSKCADDCKPCPNSIMESLSAGKPVLVSNNVGISDIIEQEGCGLVFEAEVGDIIAKINEMRDNYDTFQSKTRWTAEQYFSIPRFVKGYKELYNQLIVP